MNNEYLEITKDILNNDKFLKLKEEKHHHNSNRYKHCVDVSQRTYKVCKKLHIDYESATRAALMHDFFFDDEFKNKKESMLNHPNKALQNAEEITDLNTKEKNIIKSHMYPIGKTFPKHKESIIVDLIDDYVAIKEKVGGDIEFFRIATNFIFIVLVEILIK